LKSNDHASIEDGLKLEKAFGRRFHRAKVKQVITNPLKPPKLVVQSEHTQIWEVSIEANTRFSHYILGYTENKKQQQLHECTEIGLYSDQKHLPIANENPSLRVIDGDQFKKIQILGRSSVSLEHIRNDLIDAVPSHSYVMILGCPGLSGLLSACDIEGEAEDLIAYNR